MVARFWRFLDWLGGHSPIVLLVALLAVGGLWAFVELADEVVEGDTQALDERILRMMRDPEDPARPIGPAWLAEMGRDMTALGGVGVLVLVTGAVAGYLFMLRKFHAMWLVIIAAGGGHLVAMILKASFDRARPDIVPHLSHVYTSSFPSGHSMLSACVYLTLGALLTRLVPQRRVKVYLLVLAIVVTALVGVSRVYMGVHYPTDVLAGWTAGLVWALLCWLVARKLQNKGAVEKDTETTGTRGFTIDSETKP